MGDAHVGCAVLILGPVPTLHSVDGREAALACPETFVPVDAAIIGYVEQAVRLGRDIGRDDARAVPRDPAGATNSGRRAPPAEKR
jgi:hypothetical protein